MSRPAPRSNSQRWQRMKRELRDRGLPCYLCGQSINYSLKWPDPYSFTVEHIIPYSKSVQLREDPSNLTAAHLKCNQTRNNHNLPPSLGSRTQDW